MGPRRIFELPRVDRLGNSVILSISTLYVIALVCDQVLIVRLPDPTI